MKRNLLFLAALVLLLPVTALADSGWVIDNNSVDIQIQKDGKLLITETITADFQVEKHGIIRKLPVRYEVGLHQYALRFDLLGVTDDEGGDYRTKVSNLGNAMRIRIGDPGFVLRGVQVYQIQYSIERAILWEDDRAVLRWNAVGHEWDVPHRAASVTVHFPEGLAPDLVNFDGWNGSWGSRGRDYLASVQPDGSLRYEMGALRPHEGMTLSLSMPADSVDRPAALVRAGWWLADNFVYALFPLVLLICVLTWYRRGRDLPGRGSVTVQYEAPAGLTPLEVGVLLDERVDARDISATIINFAMQGWMSIESEPGRWSFQKPDYTLRKLKEPEGLKTHETLLFNKFFADGDKVELDDLKITYFNVLPVVRNSVYKGLTKAGYFDGNPATRRSTFLTLGILLTVALFGVSALGQFMMIGRIFLTPLILSLVLSLVVVIITGQFIPRKTSKGRRAWEEIAGLEEYLLRAEASQISTAERQGVFERLLPYAMIFGVADRWARAFEDIYTTPPNWYHGQDSQALSTVWLTSRLSRTSDDFHSSLYTAPRSSSSSSSGGWSSGGFSGGSSGGGFGGGGGSSW